MAITWVSSQEDSYNSATEINSRTISVNIGTPTNGILIVFVNVYLFNTLGDCTGVTWNGTALTKAIQTGDTSPYIDIWYLSNPEGGTHNVVISFAGNGTTTGVNEAYFVVAWANSGGTLTKDDDNTQAFTTEDPASMDLVPTTNGQLLVCSYISADNNVATKGAAETLIQDLDFGGEVSGASYAIQTSAATQGMDWDRNATGQSSQFLMAGATFKEPSGTQTPQAVAGALTSSGTTVQRAGKIVSGAVTSSGGLVNSISKVVSGALTSAGVLVNSARKVLDGELTSSGAVAAVKISFMSLAGELTSAGAVVMQSAKTLAGSITPDGGLIKSMATALSGALSSAGIVAKQIAKTMTGELTSSGIITAVKTALKEIGGELTSAGIVAMQTGKTLGGMLAPDGSLIRHAIMAVAGTLTSAGELATQLISGANEYFQEVVGELTSASVLVMQTSKIVIGVIAPDGGLIRSTAKGLSGALSSAGIVIMQTAKTMTGELTSSGVVTTLKATLKAIGGALTMAGAVTVQIGKTLAGVLAPEGSMIRQIAIAVSGTLTSAGALIAIKAGAAAGIIQSLFKGIRRALPKGFYKE